MISRRKLFGIAATAPLAALLPEKASAVRTYGADPRWFLGTDEEYNRKVARLSRRSVDPPLWLIDEHGKITLVPLSHS